MKNKRLNIYLTLFLLVQIVFVQVISNYPSFIETYYSIGAYPYISAFNRILFGWIPFSVGDVLLAVLLVVFIRFIYRLIKSRFQLIVEKLLQLTAIVSVIYWTFYASWGFNYFREPLSKNLKIQQTVYTTEQLKQVSEKIIYQLNSLQFQITKNDTLKVEVPYSSEEIYSKAIFGYDSLAKRYPQLSYTHPSIKSSLMSLLQTFNGTSGYLNPITGEAHVNDKIPKTGYPATTCHEMAHQIGYAAENEANFIGFLASTSNEDIYFQYSGYRMAFSYVISEMRKRDKTVFTELWKTVNSGIIKDFRSSSEFWSQYQNPIEPLVKKGYNSYLKANKQTHGIQSYNYVVDLLIAHFNTFEVTTTE